MVTWYTEGGVIIGDMACERVEVASSSFMQHERVAVVASSLVMWHARGCWGCIVVSGSSADMAHETVVAGSNGDMACHGAVDVR